MPDLLDYELGTRKQRQRHRLVSDIQTREATLVLWRVAGTGNSAGRRVLQEELRRLKVALAELEGRS